MRNKLLRTIFPDRELALSNSHIHSPSEGTNNASPGGLAQAFSQLAPRYSVNGIENLTSTAAASQVGSGADVFDAVSKNLDRLRSITESQVSETKANTTALSTNTAAKEASQALSAVNKASGGFLSGLTALPLVSGLLSLFGGGTNSNQRQQPLTRYAAPPSLIFDDALQAGPGGGENLQHVTYDRFGNPRTAASPTTPVPDYASILATARNTLGDSSNPSSGTGQITNTAPDNVNPTSAPTAATNVTVNIQAMDSKSFLDRSHDIAQAVREAMLNMHSINDVVNDL